MQARLVSAASSVSTRLTIAIGSAPFQLEGIGERLDLAVAQGINHPDEGDRALAVCLGERADVAVELAERGAVLHAPVLADGEEPVTLKNPEVARRVGLLQRRPRQQRARRFIRRPPPLAL